MKQLISTILLAGIIFVSTAQSDESQVKAAFGAYFQTIEKKEVGQTLDFLYPKLFDKVPRDRMHEALLKAYSDSTVAMTMYKPEVKTVSKTIETGGVKYLLVEYTFKMRVDLKGKAKDPSTDETDVDMAKFMVGAFEEKYGVENVYFDKKNKSIYIDVNTAVYAIKDPEYKGWKFIEKKENLMPLLAEILPKKVINKL